MALPSDVSAIVLAAGTSERFGSANKLVAVTNGVPVVRRTVEKAVNTGFRETIVVTGWQSDEVAQTLRGLDVRLVMNPLYSTGMASSIATGVRSCSNASLGFLVLLGDMPFVQEATLRLICSHIESPSDIVVSRSPTVRGIPTLFGVAYRETLEALSGRSGAGQIWKDAQSHVTFFDVNESEHRDIDVPEDL